MEDIKERLEDFQVGPRSWLGIDPDGWIWGSDHKGEAEWLTHVDDLAMIGIGAAISVLGWQLFTWGGGSTLVIIGDDVTGVGLINDPAAVATGAVAVVGGGMIMIGGAWQWAFGD